MEIVTQRRVGGELPAKSAAGTPHTFLLPVPGSKKTGRKAGLSSLFLGFHQSDMQLVQLFLGDFTGSAHHHIHGVFVHGEGDDLPDGVLTGQHGCEKDENGNITVIHGTYDPESKGGNSPDGRKVKGTIHWVAAKTAVKAECRLYENLIDEEKGVYNEDGSMNLNPNSLTVLKECYLEPSLKDAKAYDSFQFVRNGF